jgi:Tfp pilus assembly protein PilZ
MERVKIVFPIRFSAGTHVVQTTTRELSTAGVFIRSLLVLPVGTRLSLRLQLPRDGAIDVNGVVRVVSVEKERGFWAEFADPSAEDLQRIERTVRAVARSTPSGSTRPSGVPPENRRVFPRHPARFRIHWAPIGDLQTGFSINVSASGVFLETENPPPVGATLFMSLELPGASAPVDVQGLVAQRVTKEIAEASGTAAGAGIQFLDATDSFREALDRAVELVGKKS